MKKALHALAFTLIIAAPCFTATAQVVIKGVIKDKTGTAIPFATITEQGTDNAAVANTTGEYKITTKANTGRLRFSSVGYVNKEYGFNTRTANLNVRLEGMPYQLADIVTENSTSKGAAIMRKAIALRQQHLTENTRYGCLVYTKGYQKVTHLPKRILGRDVAKTMALDTVKNPLVYQSEALYDYYFARPDTIKEKMLYSKVAGRPNAFAWNKASDLDINYYRNIVLAGRVSVRGLVSPLADNAFAFYRFSLEKARVENGENIYQIRVTPRKQTDPVFKGVIYITESGYRLAGSDLTATTDAGLQVLDTLNIGQNMGRVNGLYVPVATNVRFTLNLLGARAAGYFAAVYKDYNTNAIGVAGLRPREAYRVDDSVSTRAEAFWEAKRPIPLTEAEKSVYQKADSLARVRESDNYLDSMQHRRNKPGLIGLFATGWRANYRKDSTFLVFDPLLDAVFYNPVEGWGGKYALTIGKQLHGGNNFWVRPAVRYGFSDKKFTANLQGQYLFDSRRLGRVSLAGGTEIADLSDKPTQSIGLMGNSFNTLLYEQNYVKLYYRKFGRIEFSHQIAPTLYGTVNAEYSDNSTLSNTTNYTLRDVKDRHFTSNNPFTPWTDAPLFKPYKAFTAGVQLRWVPGETYSTYPNVVIRREGKWPVFTAEYIKGFKDVFDSETDFDYVGLNIAKEHIPLGMAGNLSVVLSGGGFLNNNVVYFPQYHHFRGNTSLLSLPDTKRFTFLDYYAYSTNRWFAEAHAEHNFGGYFLNKISWLRTLKLEEIVGGAFLYEPERPAYFEAYIGLQRAIFRVSYGVAMQGNHQMAHGFRISIGF